MSFPSAQTWVWNGLALVLLPCTCSKHQLFNSHVFILAQWYPLSLNHLLHVNSEPSRELWFLLFQGPIFLLPSLSLLVCPLWLLRCWCVSSVSVQNVCVQHPIRRMKYHTAWYCYLCRDGGSYLYPVIQRKSSASVLQDLKAVKRTGKEKVHTIYQAALTVFSTWTRTSAWKTSKTISGFRLFLLLFHLPLPSL